MNYKIAFETERDTRVYDGLGKLIAPAGFDVVEDFEADNDASANVEAERRYPGQDWYVLDSRNSNING